MSERASLGRTIDEIYRMRKITDPRMGRQPHSNPEVNYTVAQRAALAVAQDYPVFPCDPDSKRPLTKHGFKEASQEPEKVARWWRKYPEALIGVPMGRASGLVTVDVDPDGAKWYRQHQGRLGAYRLHQTRRGKHLVYQMNGAAIRNSASEVAPGIDVRGEGGYVIWWPAHGGVAIGEPGELPGWLRQASAPAGAKRLNGHVSESEEPDGRDTRKFRDGERNDALSRRAHYYRKMGMSTKEIGAALLRYDLDHCVPPYQHTDGKSKVLYIARKKAGVLSDEEDAKLRAQDTHVELLSASEVEEKPIDWIWKGFLARNKLHLLSGAGGSMKSTLTLGMAATVSTGGTWPDGTRCPQGNVIIWTGEDDLNDTVKPRLRFAGADLSRCYFVSGVSEKGKQRSFDPAFDMDKLSDACKQLQEVSLIVIDPAISVVQRDGNSAAEVRRGLDLLITLGRERNCAVLGIHHLNKGSKGRTPGERVTGSGAWTQAPRLSLMVGAIDAGDDKVPHRWVFLCEKTQGKGRGIGYEYSFEEEKKTEITRIVWGRRLEGSPQSILDEAEGTESEGSRLGAAVKFLKNLLSDGSKNVWEINKQTEEAGIRGITLRRAKEVLHIETFRAGKNSYRWALPGDQ